MGLIELCVGSVLAHFIACYMKEPSARISHELQRIRITPNEMLTAAWDISCRYAVVARL